MISTVRSHLFPRVPILHLHSISSWPAKHSPSPQMPIITTKNINIKNLIVIQRAYFAKHDFEKPPTYPACTLHLSCHNTRRCSRVDICTCTPGWIGPLGRYLGSNTDCWNKRHTYPNFVCPPSPSSSYTYGFPI